MLRCQRAIQINTEIMCAFERLRRMLTTNAELARNLAAQEEKYDAQPKVVFGANHKLITRMEKKIQATLARVWGQDKPGETEA